MRSRARCSAACAEASRISQSSIRSRLSEDLVFQCTTRDRPQPLPAHSAALVDDGSSVGRRMHGEACTRPSVIVGASPYSDGIELRLWRQCRRLRQVAAICSNDPPILPYGKRKHHRAKISTPPTPNAARPIGSLRPVRSGSVGGRSNPLPASGGDSRYRRADTGCRSMPCPNRLPTGVCG